MHLTASTVQAFADQLAASLAEGRFVKAVLAKYRGADPDLQRINLRLVRLRVPPGRRHTSSAPRGGESTRERPFVDSGDEPQLQLVYRHSTRDITQNHPLAEGVALVRALLGEAGFRNAHLHSTDGVHELTITQRGQAHLHHRVLASAEAVAPIEAHNREKHRMLSIDRPFLVALGVTTAQHQLVPAMARKWKQINKFIEVFAGALASSSLADVKRLHIVDFGSGKGYLTFAMHDWLTQVKHVDAQVTGVELRPDLVTLCNAAIAKLGLQGLRIEQGDVRSWQPEALNVMIALHACDTATDYAIDLGLRGGADIILCSPCCHKQIRPQLLKPHPLAPILQHGVHLGQEAEMLTDGLRALLLDAAGYDTQVFEFVSLEHTNKNKMILAVKRSTPKSPEPVLAQIAEIKAFYGIREQCLETLLMDRLKRHDMVPPRSLCSLPPEGASAALGRPGAG